MPTPTPSTLPGTSNECRRVNGVLSFFGDKWTLMAVMVLRERPRRFNDMKRAIGGISQQMLTRTLRSLERDGMITRTVYPTVPPQVEYALTALGNSLSEPVNRLGQWAHAHLDEIESSRQRYDDSGKRRA